MPTTHAQSASGGTATSERPAGAGPCEGYLPGRGPGNPELDPTSLQRAGSGPGAGPQPTGTAGSDRASGPIRPVRLLQG